MPFDDANKASSSELSDVRKKDIVAKLSEPFDPDDVSWKPQTVNYKEKTATAAAYADPRVYVDRLNAIVGPDNWHDSYVFSVTPFNKYIKPKKAYGSSPATEEKQIPGNKVLCIATVSIRGMGTFSSTGDSDAADENAATSAEAQAFKRACMKFGVGRYLYDLPSSVHPYDANKGGFITKPTLPDWALPKISCQDCSKTVASYEHNGEKVSVHRIITASNKKYGKKLCADCQRTRASAVAGAAGHRLDRSV